jgi:hypothetical protein
MAAASACTAAGEPLSGLRGEHRHRLARGDVEALDEVLADAWAPGHRGRSAARRWRRQGGVADLAALGDLGEVDLAEAQAVAQHGLGEAVDGLQGRSDG